MTKHIKVFNSENDMLNYLNVNEGYLIGDFKKDETIYFHKTVENGYNGNIVQLYNVKTDQCINVTTEEYNLRYIFDKNYIKCNYLTFTGNGTISLNKYEYGEDFNFDINIEYSYNGYTWLTYTIGQTLDVSNNSFVKLRGKNNYFALSDSKYYRFTMTGEIYASGDITSLLNKCGGNITLTYQYTFAHLFYNCTSLITPPNLPSTTLSEYCYTYLFDECRNMIEAPQLPSLTLAKGCYAFMFYSCSKITHAPDLLATILCENCYKYMFFWAKSIRYIKCLAENISAKDCTDGWMYIENGVTSGTFVKSPNMNSWPSGMSGILNGWTIVDAEQ